MKNIHAMRLVLNHLHARAISAQEVLGQLGSKRVWLDREKAIRKVSGGIFHGGYEINEDTSCDDLVVEMTEKLDAIYVRETHAGVDCYVFQPFAKGGRREYNHELGLGYLSSLADHTDAIRHTGALTLGTGHPDGLSTDEEDWLSQILESRSISLINAFRDAETALHYVRTARAGVIASCGPENVVGEDDLIDAKLAQFTACIAIKGMPAAARHFGSDSPAVNHIHTLPDDILLILGLPTDLVSLMGGAPCQV